MDKGKPETYFGGSYDSMRRLREQLAFSEGVKVSDVANDLTINPDARRLRVGNVIDPTTKNQLYRNNQRHGQVSTGPAQGVEQPSNNNMEWEVAFEDGESWQRFQAMNPGLKLLRWHRDKATDSIRAIYELPVPFDPQTAHLKPNSRPSFED